MKAAKIILVALVLVGALFFIYMKVATKKPVPQDIPSDDQARIRLEQTMQALPAEVDPEQRMLLENFMIKK